METIKKLLSSKTILTTILLGAVLFIPDFQKELVTLMPAGFESSKIVETILLAAIAWFRSHPEAKF